jgi:hypothetical protein
MSPETSRRSAVPEPDGHSDDTEGVEAFFAGHPLGRVVFDSVRSAVATWPDVAVRVSRSQVAFRRRRGFAWLWLPGRYLRSPAADVVLSLALGRRDPSPRWKEVVRPAPGQWMHHLEIGAASDVDDEVAGWLREAAARAGGPP